jgi:hypothetical protein
MVMIINVVKVDSNKRHLGTNTSEAVLINNTWEGFHHTATIRPLPGTITLHTISKGGPAVLWCLSLHQFPLRTSIQDCLQEGILHLHTISGILIIAHVTIHHSVITTPVVKWMPIIGISTKPKCVMNHRFHHVKMYFSKDENHKPPTLLLLDIPSNKISKIIEHINPIQDHIRRWFTLRQGLYR